MRKVALEKAVGLRLGHDITEVEPEAGIKRCAFKRGHTVKDGDLEYLRRLGKHSLYIQDDNEDEVHEDDAALKVSPLAAGNNINFDPAPTEGKISFYAACSGVFVVDVERLYSINALEIPSLPTIHTNSPVKEGQQVAAFRIIPLTCERGIVEKVCSVLETPLFRVEPYILRKAGIIVTGNEVYEGRIKDSFIPELTRIVREFNVDVIETAVLPDRREEISAAVERFSDVCDIVFVTGGTSVDPDDVTVLALSDAGVEYAVRGNPVQPGNNFTIGYRNNAVVCAVPAAAIFYKVTSLNIFLPRLLAGQKVSREDFHRAGHGGLCLFCEECHFPVCPFGKTS